MLFMIYDTVNVQRCFYSLESEFKYVKTFKLLSNQNIKSEFSKFHAPKNYQNNILLTSKFELKRKIQSKKLKSKYIKIIVVFLVF